MIDATSLEHAAKRSYEYEGDRKGCSYIGWEREPEEVKIEWRESVGVAIAAYRAAENVGTAEGWQDISTAPTKGEFLAENQYGDWMKVRRFDPGSPNDFSKNAVINGRMGRWWYAQRWRPLPPALTPSGRGGQHE